MHELLLFGQVRSNYHGQILKVLAALSAMQPQVIAERHIIFKPTRTPSNTVQIGAKQGVQSSQLQIAKAQQGDLFYVQLVETMSTDRTSGAHDQNADISNGDHAMGGTDGTTSGGHEKQSNLPQDNSKPRWSLEFRDLPEVPGRRPVTSRLMASVPIKDGDAVKFVEALGYTYTSEYALHGHQFFHNNIILLLHRPLILPASTPNTPVKQIPPLASLRPIDPSNTYILQASIRVQDGGSPEAMTIGMNELKNFKEAMKGVVDMEVGDRLALDTRFR